jgi:hypothetical protein
MQCLQNPTIDSALREIAFGFRRMVTRYGVYDVNGYRFRSEVYESTKPRLTTVNTGVCVHCIDEDDNELEYYGIIKDILKVKLEGHFQLEMALFDCCWFDPTSDGTRRTPNLGLVEIKHSSRLAVFEPFVMASQVKLVYYLPYACNAKSDLMDWWVVHIVSPRNYILPNETTDDDSNHPNEPTEVLFYQEDGLPGSFVTDLGAELDNIVPIASDEITNPADLDFLAKLTEGEDEDMDESDGDGEDDQDMNDLESEEDGGDDQDDLPEYAPNDPNDF